MNAAEKFWRNMMFAFERFGTAPALLCDDGRTITYAELNEESRQLSSALPERSLVFCLCRNSPGSVLGYVTCLNHGHVPLLLAEALDPAQLDALLRIYRPAFLWLPEERAAEFTGMSARHHAWGYTLLETGYAESYLLHKDLCLLLTTSGSTGSPKLVRHTGDNLRSNIQSIIEYLAVTSSERPITTLPMHYTYGLSVINIHLAVGAPIILTEHTVMQQAFWERFTTCEATSMAGVPYTYAMLRRLGFFRMALPSLRSLNQAGGKLPPELQDEYISWAEKTGRTFYVMYGQTEASPRMGYLPWEKAREKHGSMGIAIPGGRFSLIDTDGNSISTPGVVGELVYEGPNVTPGYAECGEDLCLGDERHGILHTGDMAMFDADGFFTVVGRKKRFLKVFGNRVNLDEIEYMLREAYPAMDAACAGVDDLLYVFITDASLCEAVKDMLADKTRLHHSAFKVIYLKAIPQNASGKTLYQALEAYYA